MVAKDREDGLIVPPEIPSNEGGQQQQQQQQQQQVIHSTLPTLWLRSELDPKERRTPLTPKDAERLVTGGKRTVVVEKSLQRIFKDEDYVQAGCTLVEAGTWDKDAPDNALILGLGPLPGDFPLRHQHLYFGYSFKNQLGWEDRLARFLRGGGKLLDIEYLVDDKGRRLTSFGGIAGYIGMAAGLLAWARQELQIMNIDIPSDILRKFDNLPLLEHIRALMNTAVTFAKRTPSVVVIGANGIVGTGAVALAEQLGLSVTKWTREHTQRPGPYPELLDFSILFNAIKLAPVNTTTSSSSTAATSLPASSSPAPNADNSPATRRTSVFLTDDLIRTATSRSLSVVVDVSCDIRNPNNPLPIYHQSTTFERPTVRILDGPELPLDVIAIPTLSSLLPYESSRDFSGQLLPHLEAFLTFESSSPRLTKPNHANSNTNFVFKKNEIWARVERYFIEKCRLLSPVPLPRNLLPTEDQNVFLLSDFKPTLLQEYLWNWHQEHPTGYNLAHAVKLSIPTLEEHTNVLATLQLSLNRLIEEQEVLRTNFRKVAEETETLRMFIAKERSVEIINVDLSTVSQEVQSNQLRSLTQQAFNLERDPLLRVALLRVKEEETLLVLCAHQIIADSQSLKLLAQRLLTSFSSQEVLHYADVAHWERNRWTLESLSKFEGEEAPLLPLVRGDKEEWQDKQLGYWKRILDGSLHVLSLPIDSSRSAVQEFHCVRKEFAFSTSLSENILKLSQRLRVSSSDVASTPTTPSQSELNDRSVYVLLLAAFKVLLFRLCGESDLIVGSIIPGRSIASTRRLLGPFANNLALRSFVHGGMTFHEVWEKVKETVEGALAHQEVPFERLFELLPALANAAKKGPNCLFQVRFSLTGDSTEDSSSSTSISLQEFKLQERALPFDLDIEVRVNRQGAGTPAISFVVHHNSRLYTEARIREMFSQLDLLLTQIVSESIDAHNIVSYTLVTEQARPLLPNPYTPLDSTWRGSIQEHFYQKAQQHPERTAICYTDQTITYGELSSVTNQFANWLLARNAGAKRSSTSSSSTTEEINVMKPSATTSVVAIYGHRSPAVVAAIMGILTAGAAYTMIDPAYPSSRIIQCLDIAEPVVWVGIKAAGPPPDDLKAYLDSKGIIQLTMPQPEEASRLFTSYCSSTTYPNIAVGPDSIAVVTFTSGSTGLPKGVMGRHGPLTHYYPWMAKRFGIGETDRFSMCSGIAHDPLQRDIFTPLFFGATIYIPTQDDISQPGRLSAWMKEKEVTVTCMTPALGQILTTIDIPSFTIDSLRNAFFVGDQLIKRDVNRLRRLAPNVRCINMYGSTETQRSVGYFEVPSLEELEKMPEVIPGGVGMLGCDVLLLNASGQLAGVGEVCEIYMRSHHLALGYVGLEEQTREKFLPNPFSNVPGDRLYRTGDLGRYTPEGIMQCFGRADDQVKIRGFRIELGEINATLSLHPSVKENVTIVRDDCAPNAEKRLVSYVVPTEFDGQGQKVTGAIDSTALSRELRAFLTAKLPSYMVPTYVVILQTMPLTPNGKINRGGLPQPVEVVAVATPASPSPGLSRRVVPLSETESKLIRVWSAVLAVQIGSPEDNFFELGGHSVSATRLTFEINKAFNIEVPMQLLFRAPTVSSMAKAIDRLLQKGTGAIDEGEFSTIDLSKEVEKLSNEIPTVTYTPISGSPKNILLTGVTGFLGAFLLHELLTQDPEVKVYCIVRAANDKEANTRVMKNLQSHLLWMQALSGRFFALAGDLSKTRFGLTEESYSQLAAQIDLVLHNGAHVHWLQPYEKLAPTNVNGTLEAIKFCCQSKTKPLHHVSTTSVFDSEYHSNLKTVYEEDPLEAHKGINGGYPQTKWVAEKLVMKARSKGLPCSIYRPGYVSGDSKNGIWNTDDFLCRFIKGCVQLGVAPRVPGAKIDMSSVDRVCNVIARLALERPESSKSYHCTNPTLFTFDELFSLIQSFGYPLKVIDAKEWREKLMAACVSTLSSTSTSTSSENSSVPTREQRMAEKKKAANRGPEWTKIIEWLQELNSKIEPRLAVKDDDEEDEKEVNALSAMITYFTEEWTSNFIGGPVFDVKNVVEDYESLAYSSSSSSGDIVPRQKRLQLAQSVLLALYFSYFIRCSFLHPPPKEANNSLHIDWNLIGAGVQMLTRTDRH